MAASDYVPIFFKYRLHLAGRPQMSSRPNLKCVLRALSVLATERARAMGRLVAGAALWVCSCVHPALAFNPAASMPAIAQISSLSEVSPLTPTAPSRTPPSWISTPPGTGTIRPCASVFTAPMK